MNAYIVAASILLQVAKADWSGDLSAVSSAAGDLAQKVSKWSSGDGLQGALGIQGSFPTLSKAVAALSGDAGSLSDDTIKPQEIDSFVSSVVSLLNGLTEKAKDFSSVGASSIVTNDLNELSQPSADIIKSIIAAVSKDDAKVGSLTGALSSIEGGFSKAIDAYSAKHVDFPPAPTGGNGGGKSAAPSGGKSAAGSSAAGSSAAATHASSSAAVSAATSSPATSSVAVSNGGAKAAAGIAAAGAGVVALLI